MPLLADPVFLWSMLAIQMVGLASMVLARMPHTSSVHAICRVLFLGCLVLVGLTTVYAMGCHSSCWAWSGTIFSIMAVGATADLGPAVHVSGF
jgi:hypothetical protein